VAIRDFFDGCFVGDRLLAMIAGFPVQLDHEVLGRPRA
jgi:hypothetical protein